MQAAGLTAGKEKSASRTIVAIVGAPNVGKSRLFNRLTGSRSIVHDRPGVTRDRIEAFCEWSGRKFAVLDTGGMIPGEADELSRSVQSQVLKGVRDAHLLLFVVDGSLGMTPLDQSLAPLLRKSGKSIVLVVNKGDVEGHEDRSADFFHLGFSDPVAVSAEEGRGIGTLLDRIVAELPAEVEQPAALDSGAPPIGLAVVGRPNVGKSTLFNQLAGEERAVVSSLPGTTRDPVEEEFERRGRRYRIIDTAGLRRKARAEAEDVELQSASRALSIIKKADIVVAVLDATEPGTHQDLAVIGACLRMRRPLMVVLNKMDKVGKVDAWAQTLERTRERLHFSPEVPMVAVSALQRVGLPQVWEVLEGLAQECSRKVPTPVLNAALEQAVARRTPSARDRVPKLYYITQTGQFPPSFIVFTNGAKIEMPYRRYLAKQLKESLDFKLAPLALRFRQRT